MLINFIKHIAVFIFLLLLVFSVTYADDKSENKQMMEKYNHFDNPQVCSGCHWEKFDRWNVSQHSRGLLRTTTYDRSQHLVLRLCASAIWKTPGILQFPLPKSTQRRR